MFQEYEQSHMQILNLFQFLKVLLQAIKSNVPDLIYCLKATNSYHYMFTYLIL